MHEMIYFICPEAISYARTTTRNVKREPGHVMYSAGAVTTVLAKAAGMEDEVELWEVEVGETSYTSLEHFLTRLLFSQKYYQTAAVYRSLLSACA